MNKKYKFKKALSTVVFFAIFLSAAFLLGVLIGIFGYGNGSGSFYVIGMLMYFMTFYLQIIIHECGHMIFGLMTGYKFRSIRFGSIMIVSIEGKLRFKRYSLAGTGGQCLMSPPELVDGKMPYVLYNLGGSFLNLIFAAIFLVLGLTVNVPYLDLFFLMNAIWGLSTALQNGIPLELQVPNDGSNTVALSKSKTALRGFWLSMKTVEALGDNRRLGTMPEEWFEVYEGEDLTQPLASHIIVAKCDRLLDLHRFADAKTELTALLDSGNYALNDVTRTVLTDNLICCEAFTDNRPETYERFLTPTYQKYEKALAKNIGVIRTTYVRALLIEYDAEKAGKALIAFDKLKNTYPYPSDYELESELMAIADKLAKERKNNQ
ncbi:MAG: site-2 protease family protein [Clostridia bacterium]|nr:site-2 protease family protein [Clostridia bacterium]